MEIKKKISLTINKATPRLRPFCTAKVWLPINDPSATTSRNHKIMANNVAKNPSDSNVPPLAYPLKYITADKVKVNKANDVIKGHGEGSTKW